jgi:uncharacterized OB-fold protein
MTDPVAHPLPEITPHSRPHWDGLSERKFLIQRCDRCGSLRHYPRPVCSACYATDHSWIEASGDATVHSWTVAHHAYHPAFKIETPYTLVTADLAEGVRILARFQGADAATLRIGLPLRISYRRVAEDLVLPVLEPA